MAVLKQSTTYTRAFLLVESSDHITGLTGATATVNLSKAGGAFAAAGGTVTEIANGFYKIALTTTDTNTLGDLAFHITATSADPTDFVDQVTVDIPGASVSSVTGNVGGNVVGSVASVTAGVTVTTNNDKAGYALSATGSAALTEGYPSLHSTGTLPQLLYEIRSLLAEKSVSGTTLTTNKLDGLTVAETFTLNSSTAPTSITRAS